MMDHLHPRSPVEIAEDRGEFCDIRIAATFTSEPIGEPLQNSLAAFSIRPQLRFAPYRQLIQQLLSQRTDLITGGRGINIFLLRAEDFSSSELPRTAATESQGSASSFGKHKTYVLPNGMEIAHLNSYETGYLYKEIFEERVYESNGVTIRDGATVLDIGANIGMFALSVVQRHQHCRVLAFEPGPAAFEVLRTNAEMHGRGNILAFRCGVWSTSGSRKFTSYVGSSVFSGFVADPIRDAEALRAAIANAFDAKGVDADRREELTRKFLEDRLIKEEQDCPVRCLADIFAEYDISTVDLLKIDAEGSEFEILSGIADDDWARIEQIVLEVHESAGVACSDICAVLAAKGYRVQVREEAALAGSGLKNVYATREAKRRNGPPAETLQNLHDFASCLQRFADANRVHCIAAMAPPSPGLHPQDHEELVAALSQHLRNKPYVHFLSLSDFGELEVSDYYDETRDRAANIPYKPRYFEFMSSTLSSVIASIVKGPRKVIALDADGTLWDGVCAEELAEDLRADAHLQGFMRDRAREGMLLCLVSKNNMEDVQRVFAANRGMVLEWSDFAAVRANWSAKSANLASIAAQLGLSLDSFIFLDDNPIECAEVRANCPRVLTLCLPPERERLPALLDRVCFLQNLNITDEDGHRSQMYRENVAREQHRNGFDSLREYIGSLRLEVLQEPISGASVGRVAQLTARTNQFNIRKVTRTPDEIAALLSSGYQGYAARVRDRFGDYGLTGVVIYQLSGHALRVDTLMLSCRVLGRGVEYELVRRLGSIALEHRIDRVIFDAVPTDRNAPAMDFLSGLECATRYEQDANVVFEFSSQYLATVSFDPDRAAPMRASDAPTVEQRREEPSIAETMEADDVAGSAAGEPPIAQYIARVVRSVRDVPLHKLSPHLPFAALGIDSFSQVEILVRLEKDFGRLPSTLLFDQNTIHSLGGYLARFHQRRVDELSNESRVTSLSAPRQPRPDVRRPPDLDTAVTGSSRRLSYNQEAMWASHGTDDGVLAYNVPLTITLRGEVDASILSRSLQGLVLRHEVLRTRFIEVEGAVTCEVDESPDVDLPVVDLSQSDRKIQEARIRVLMDEESRTRFDLAAEYPIRWKLVRLNRKRHLLLLTLHHVVCDGWSIRILFRDLAAFYDSLARSEDVPLQPLQVCYRDYVRWEQGQYESGGYERQLAYWKSALAGTPLLLTLPLDRPRPSLRTFASAVYVFSIPRVVGQDLRLLSVENGCSLYVTVLSAFSLLLHLYSGQRDLVFGSPTANRELEGTRDLIGYFTNVLPVRVRFGGAMTFLEVLDQVSNWNGAAQEHKALPFAKLLELLNVERSASHSPLVQTVFAFQNTPIDAAALLNAHFSMLERVTVECQFELMVEVQDYRDELSVRVEYLTDLFDGSTIERFASHFLALLEKLAIDPELPIHEHCLLSESERSQQVVEWNATARAYADEKCMHELFEEQVRLQPDAIALVHEEGQLSYGELNRRANQLAHCLVEAGAQPEVRIGVCMDRSVEMVAAILGVLKAGACYVPMDPRYPQDRLRYIEKDADVSLVLTQSHLRCLLSAAPMCVDAMGASLRARPEENPSQRAIATNLAYVIYTSGSTGKPKGVAIQHRSALSFLAWVDAAYGRERMQSVLASTSICFDLSVYELFGPLGLGGECVIVDDILSLDQSLAQERVRLLNTVPSAIKALLSKNAIPAGVRTINLAGERLVPELVDRLYELGTVADVHDLYGPSEATTYSTHARRSPQGVETIGRPVANTSIYVLDEGTLVPRGVAGEIFVGGEGLARGYLGRPGLTAERFVPDPFSDEAGRRLYRTGDLGRYLPDGSLEYLGRLDQQVKLRGYRIELGEIESALLHHADLREAVVVAHEADRDSTQLVAYVVPQRSAETGGGETGTEEQADTLAEEWRRVFDEELYRAAVGRESVAGSDAKNWFDGWVSSYDRSPLGLEEMQVWADLAVARIRALGPQDILEVGCGLGLLALRLLPDCRSYVGSDFSRSALDALAANIPADQRSRVQLHCCEAKDFDAYQGKQFDAIVLNSVVQYFPDVEYLLQTVAGALRHVRPGGALFLGDVRNYELLAAFATSLELGKEAALLDVDALRAAVHSRMAKENELLVSPRFFEQLKGQFPQITHVELLPKYDFSHQGMDNELFRYRYDVVLTVAGEIEGEAVAEAVIDWRARGFDAEYFRSELAAGRPALCMRHVPDTRLSRDLRIFGLLQAEAVEREASLRDLIAGTQESAVGGIAMDSYIALAGEYGYRADVSLVGASRGEYCLHLRRPGQGRVKSVLAQPGENVDLRLLASDPMRARREAELKSRLRDYLQERLPEYMVPAAFVVLPQLPLNANGKVDRKALPPPDNNAFAREAYVSPSSRRERVLVEIWERVLNASRIGVKDNFFALGGDSILSIQVVSQAKSRGFGLSTKAIFEHPTIAALALQMVDAVQAIPQKKSQGELPLLPIQRIFFQDNPRAVHHYHQSLLVCVPERFELEFLKAVVAALYDRHDALRLRFSRRDGQWRGTYSPVTDDVITQSTVECDLGGLSEQERKSRIARWGQSIKESIDITRGPLLRTVFFRADDWRHSRLLLVIHHLVVDGVSWRILLNDLEQAFGQWSGSGGAKAIRLAQKTHGVDVWARKLAAYCREARLEEEKSYWISRLSSAVPPLPQDGDVPADDCYGASEHVRVELSTALTGALLNNCHHAYRTRINDLLLSGLFLAVFKWTGQRALRIGLEGHGREELFEAIDVNQSVGWFTSLFPLTLRVSPTWSAGRQDSLQELIRSVKEELRTLPNNGIGYGLLRHLAADEELLRLDEPTDILFNYLGRFDSVFHGAKWFSNAPEHTGSNVGPKLRRTHRLAINGVVQDGRLCFDIDFHPRTYARATVEAFGSGLEQSLQEIVTHCRQQVRSRFSPSDFPLACLQQGEIDALQERYPRLADCYAASDLQSGLIFHALMDEARRDEGYVVQVYLTLEAQIDVARFKDAWNRVAERHDCFRSAFTGFERDEVLQVVLDSIDLPWIEMDWREKSESELLAAFDAYARAERSAGFEFATAPLMRFTLIRERDARYRFMWTHHHSLLDGWSLIAVLGEVIGYYSELPAVAASGTGTYKDYLAWLRSRDHERAREFWTKELRAAERRAPLSLRRPAVGSADVGAQVKTWRLSARQTKAIEALARRHKVTMNVVVIAGWAYLLSRYSGSDTVVLGQTVSGRDPAIRHVEEIVGLLIRTIPVCVEVAGGLAIGEWLNRLHARSVERERYSYYPLPEIQRCSGLAASAALFDSLVVFENYPIDEVLQDAARPGTDRGRTGASLPIGLIGSHEATNYELTLLVLPKSELGFKLSYRAERFAQESIDRLMRHFLVVLDGMAAGRYSAVAELPLLSVHERRQQLIEWNATAQAYADDKCMHELFEEQVERTPNTMAVLHEVQSLTYRQLNGRANQLARRLKVLGVGPDQRVALCMERSVEMVVGVLGILKAGAAYVPLDPNYPIERLQYMLEDAAPRVVLTQEKLKDLLPRTQAEVVTLDTQPADAAGSGENLSKQELGLTPQHLVYVIYTSGSTGRPKGTAMHHRAMVNLIEWHRGQLALDAGARVLQFAALSFDVAFQETFSTLCTGGTLVLIDEWVRRDAGALLALLHRQAVQRLFVPPLMLQSLAESVSGGAPGPLSLKDVITAGEQLRISSEIADFFRHLAGCRLHNHYGPTETHVVTALTLTGDPQQWPALPTIGQPISNTQIYILDGKRQPVPLGVVGEIYIGGANVACGYLNRPELTAERFVRDPFSGDERARLYKTGDLGRWLEDGTIEYLGRNDDQVKVRGYRVELGEVEAQLSRHAQVREAAVVAREDIRGDKRLVAYVTQRENGPSVEELRGYLKQALPEHMVPSAFVVLESLPLTPSGKLNRRALPAPELAAYVTREYEAPQGEIEAAIARIWQDILHVHQVSRQDNFFELGGHSLLAMQLVSRIRETFSTELPVRQVFEHTTLSSQAKAVEQARNAGARTQVPLEAVSREEPLPLSYAQQRMLFLDEYMR